MTAESLKILELSQFYYYFNYQVISLFHVTFFFIYYHNHLYDRETSFERDREIRGRISYQQKIHLIVTN